ncbi:MAG: hypothetical protein SFV19_20490 [Rhodospirillaceae bacterium]|nr:hypothetical protein [Rhodospirillaceae bacterium]
MNLKHLTLACAVVLAPMLTAAQQPQTAVTPEAGEMKEAFAPIAFMAGSCWDGPLPDFVSASTGLPPQTVSHCVRWRLENQVLTDTLRMDATTPPVQGESNYYWDAETKTLRYIFWSVDGRFSTGTVKAEGDTLIFDDERLFGRKGVVHFVTTWTPQGADVQRPDAFVQTRRRQNADGTWTHTATATFKRSELR